MHQQVNFFQRTSSKKKDRYSAGNILAVFSVVFAALVLVGIYMGWKYWSLERERVTLHNRLQRLEAVRKEYASPPEDATLEAELQNLLALEEKQKAVSLVLSAGNGAGNTTGVSAYIEGLGRGRVEGLWLTRVNIEGDAARIDLKGSALRPELASVLIQRLSEDRAFAGKPFNSLSIERAQEDSQRIDFSLDAEFQEKPDKDGKRSVKNQP